MVFQQLLNAVGPMNCRSVTHSIEKKCDPIPTVGRCTLRTVGWMHCIFRSDEQTQQVGCKTVVGWMHNFCRQDAQLLQVGAQFLQVGCTHLQNGCKYFIGQMTHMYGKMHVHISQLMHSILTVNRLEGGSFGAPPPLVFLPQHSHF